MKKEELNVLKTKTNMYNKKALKRFLPGGINDGGGWELPNGFGVGIGSTSSGTYPFSQQAKQDEIFAAGMGLGPKPSSIPQNNQFKSDNPFEYITKTGLGSWSETRNGTTVDADGNPFQNYTAPQEKIEEESDLVGQERKKNKWIGFGGEEFVNVKNAAKRGVLGYVDRLRNNKIGYNLQLDLADPLAQVGSTNEIDEGDTVAYGQKTGDFRQPQMGQKRNSRSTFGNYAGDTQLSKFGGYLQDGGTNGYSIGQEIEMEPWELEQFLAAGGEVDYI
jgi:hypothetical protein